MGDVVKISLCVPSTCVPNAIIFLLNKHSLPNCLTYVAIDNPLLTPPKVCDPTSSYL
jgi:hypothetical protein